MTFLLSLLLAQPALPASPAGPSLEAAWTELRAVLPGPQPPAGTPSDGPGTCLYFGRGGAAPAPAVAEALRRSRAVLVGETHDQVNDHLAQLDVLEGFAAAHPAGLAVGFEMLNEDLQPVLDAYAAGELSEGEFLEKADWRKEWGFPFALYKPLFEFVRAHRLKALALNAPRGLVTRTARFGLEGLSAEERARLPKDMALSQDPRYLEFLRSAFSGHGIRAAELRVLAMPGVTWEHYQQAMMIWNEVMAANAAAYLNADPGRAVLVVAGNGHVMYGAGIPFGIGRRAPGAVQTTFYTEGASSCPASLPGDLAGLADFVWLVPH